MNVLYLSTYLLNFSQRYLVFHVGLPHLLEDLCLNISYFDIIVNIVLLILISNSCSCLEIQIIFVYLYFVSCNHPQLIHSRMFSYLSQTFLFIFSCHLCIKFFSFSNYVFLFISLFCCLDRSEITELLLILSSLQNILSIVAVPEFSMPLDYGIK